MGARPVPPFAKGAYRHGTDGFHQENSLLTSFNGLRKATARWPGVSHAGHGNPRTAAPWVVRESQMAIFVNEEQRWRRVRPRHVQLTTQTLPVLTYLKNWDKLFGVSLQRRCVLLQHAPTDRPSGARPNGATGTLVPCVCIAFGNRLPLPIQAVHRNFRHARNCTVSGRRRSVARTGCRRTSARPLPPVASFLDLAATRRDLPEALSTQLEPEMASWPGKSRNRDGHGNVSLPEELQKILDQKISMGMGRRHGEPVRAVPDRAVHPRVSPKRLVAGVVLALQATPRAWEPVLRWARCWRRTRRPDCKVMRRQQLRQLRRRLRQRSNADDSNRHAGEAGRPESQGHPRRQGLQPRKQNC